MACVLPSREGADLATNQFFGLFESTTVPSHGEIFNDVYRRDICLRSVTEASHDNFAAPLSSAIVRAGTQTLKH
jgi:hypothetical protein